MAINIAIQSGNLTRDPELKQTTNGTPVLNTSIAQNKKIKKGNEWVDSVMFIDVTCYGKLAERVAEYLKKGDHVAFTGRIDEDNWEDKDGNKRTKKFLVANEAEFLRWGKDRQTKDGDAPF